MAIFNVVRFEGLNDDWLLYKYNGDEINNKSKLIVGTGQVAIIVHNGKIEKIFEEGTYTLNSELLPILKIFQKGIYGGENPYPIEVYFINKRLKLDLFWGTSDPIKLLDPIYKIQLRLRARGQMGVRLAEYQFFFQTLVGSLLKDNYITFDVIRDYFRGVTNQRIKRILSSFMIKQKVTYFEIDPHLDLIQENLQTELKKDLNKFGFDLVNLSIESINVPEEDLSKLNEILHKKAEYEQLGDDVYRTTRGYDVLEAGAKNNNSASTFMGVGLGMQMANQTNMAGGIIPPKPPVKKKYCSKCGAEVAKSAKFCSECGASMALKCPNCDFEVTARHKFCPNCGEKLKKEEA